ncbi:MAG: hypothetical protein WC223_05080 [Bacteroidales bacterium]|jgi:hypothetical protein
MTETIEKYDPVRIERIKKNLKKAFDIGSPEYFEIIIDNLKIVKRTNDFTRFSNLYDNIEDGTQKISILLYGNSAKSPRHIKYTFLLKEEPQQQTLSGFDFDTKMKENIEREREKWETDILKKELEKTKEMLSEAEEYIETLEVKVKEKDDNKDKVNWDATLAGTVTELVRNEDFMSIFPGGKALAGAFDSANRKKDAPPKTEDANVTFSKETTSSDNAVSEEEKVYMQILKKIESRFDQQQMDIVMAIMENLAQNTSDIIPVAELLKIDIKTKIQNQKKQ